MPSVTQGWAEVRTFGWGMDSAAALAMVGQRGCDELLRRNLNWFWATPCMYSPRR